MGVTTTMIREQVRREGRRRLAGSTGAASTSVRKKEFEDDVVFLVVGHTGGEGCVALMWIQHTHTLIGGHTHTAHRQTHLW